MCARLSGVAACGTMVLPLPLLLLLHQFSMWSCTAALLLEVCDGVPRPCHGCNLHMYTHCFAAGCKSHLVSRQLATGRSAVVPAGSSNLHRAAHMACFSHTEDLTGSPATCLATTSSCCCCRCSCWPLLLVSTAAACTATRQWPLTHHWLEQGAAGGVLLLGTGRAASPPQVVAVVGDLCLFSQLQWPPFIGVQCALGSGLRCCRGAIVLQRSREVTWSRKWSKT